MTAGYANLPQTALTLRQEFDRSFAAAPRMEAASIENFLAVRAGDDAYAIRVAEVGGLYVDRRIMPLPTMLPELLGVTGFRGQIIPVYDLAALLGQANQTAPRWLILTRFSEPLALAFDVFESHFSALPEQIISSGADTPIDKGAERSHLCDVIHTDDTVLPIIQLQSLIEKIQRRIGSQRRNQA